MKINISDKAINYFLYLIKKKKKVGIKLEIINSGCLGLKHNIKYINNINNNDYTFKKKNLIILIKKKEIIYFNNIKIDILENDFKKKIIFNNKNIKKKCKCGESFK